MREKLHRLQVTAEAAGQGESQHKSGFATNTAQYTCNSLENIFSSGNISRCFSTVFASAIKKKKKKATKSDLNFYVATRRRCRAEMAKLHWFQGKEPD